MATRIDKWREARLMATSIAAALETAQARFVLITSPSARDGKSLFVDLLQREFQSLGLTRFLLMDWPDLQHYSPGASDDTIVLIDGPPLAEGEGIMQIPAEWLGALDGALIVVNKRKTRRDDLQQSVSWLRATGIEPLGIIWNEHGLPPITDAVRRWRDHFERVKEERRQRRSAPSQDPRGTAPRRRPTQPGVPRYPAVQPARAQPGPDTSRASMTTPPRPAGVQPVDVAASQAGHMLGSDDILESAPLAPAPGEYAQAGPSTAPLESATAGQSPSVEQPPEPDRPSTHPRGSALRPVAPSPPSRGRFRGDS